MSLTGECADEIFGGYNIYHEPYSVSWYYKIPYFIRRSIGVLAYPFRNHTGFNFLVRRSKKLEDRYVGNIHHDYKSNTYILEHYVKEHNVTLYVKYMLEEDIRTIEDYSNEITNMIIETNPEKSEKDYNEIYNMLLDEIDNKNDLNEQVKFISMMIRYLNGKKCNS